LKRNVRVFPDTVRDLPNSWRSGSGAMLDSYVEHIQDGDARHEAWATAARILSNVCASVDIP